MRRRDPLPDPEVARTLRELDAALAGDPTADPDLAVLVADVHATRPEPDAAFLASLDARVHAGFPAERPARRRGARFGRFLALGSAVGAVAAVVLVIVLLPGGGSDDNASVSSSAGSEAAPSRQAAPADASSGGSGGGAAPARSVAAVPPAPTPAAPAPAGAPRKVQRAAQLTLTTKPADVQGVADDVVRETQAAGGYVQSSQVSTSDGGGGAQFTVRVPTAKLDTALARLSKLAHVSDLTQSTDDITAAFTSAADRLSDARAERRALLRALARADTAQEIASLRARLRINRSEIAQRKGALEAQRRRANLATVLVTVEGNPKADQGGGGGWTPRDALHDAGRVLEVAGGVAVVGLAVLAPLAVLALVVAAGARVLRRRRRATALDRA